MEIKLLPGISLLPETPSALIVPEEMLARALNGNPHLQQFRICIAQPMKQATDGIILYAITLDQLGSNN